MRGFFRVFIADEVHEYKAKDSDQGWAFGLLARCTPAVITLTGTFFSGPASSIFWVLHRTQPSVRAEYGFDDEMRWVSNYGILETLTLGVNCPDSSPAQEIGEGESRAFQLTVEPDAEIVQGHLGG